MMRNWLSAALAAISLLCGIESASAQFLVVASCPNGSVLYAAGQPGRVGLVDVNGNHCIAGSVTSTPSGTQNVNISQVLGAAPSLTNPLWMTPATGATFATTQSTSPWIVVGGGTAGASGTAALTVQGIANGTALPTSAAAGTQLDLLTVVGTKAAGTAAANSVLEGAVYNTTVPAPTNGQQVAAQADAAGSHQVNTEGKKATYSLGGGVAPAASATDVVTLFGSASKTIRVTRIAVSGTATALTTTAINIQKRSAANTGGTSAALTTVPHDSATSAASATGLQYTANPTINGNVGNIRNQQMSFSTTVGQNTPAIFDFTTRNGSGIVLRGTAQGIAIYLGGVTVTGGLLNYDIEWTEE